MATWILPTDKKANPWLPLPVSAYSSLDRMSIRAVNRIICYPPPEWYGNTIFLADMYADKWNARLRKLEAEAKRVNARWITNPLPTPQGVEPEDWMFRCLAADRRERRALEADSDETIKPQVDGASEAKTSIAKVKAAKAKAAKAKGKAKKMSSM